MRIGGERFRGMIRPYRDQSRTILLDISRCFPQSASDMIGRSCRSVTGSRLSNARGRNRISS